MSDLCVVVLVEVVEVGSRLGPRCVWRLENDSKVFFQESEVVQLQILDLYSLQQIP